MKYVGSTAGAIAGIIDVALTVVGTSIGGVIVNAIDYYVDPKYGAKKGNGWCFG